MEVSYLVYPLYIVVGFIKMLSLKCSILHPLPSFSLEEELYLIYYCVLVYGRRPEQSPGHSGIGLEALKAAQCELGFESSLSHLSRPIYEKPLPSLLYEGSAVPTFFF